MIVLPRVLWHHEPMSPRLPLAWPDHPLPGYMDLDDRTLLRRAREGFSWSPEDGTPDSLRLVIATLTDDEAAAGFLLSKDPSLLQVAGLAEGLQKFLPGQMGSRKTRPLFFPRCPVLPLACQCGSAGVASVLLAHGADPCQTVNEEEKDNRQPFRERVLDDEWTLPMLVVSRLGQARKFDEPLSPSWVTLMGDLLRAGADPLMRDDGDNSGVSMLLSHTAEHGPASTPSTVLFDLLAVTLNHVGWSLDGDNPDVDGLAEVMDDITGGYFSGAPPASPDLGKTLGLPEQLVSFGEIFLAFLFGKGLRHPVFLRKLAEHHPHIPVLLAKTHLDDALPRGQAGPQPARRL